MKYWNQSFKAHYLNTINSSNLCLYDLSFMQKSNYYTITTLAPVVAHITGTNSATVLEDKWLCLEYYVCVYSVVFCQHFVSLLNAAVQM